jgi:hypothetical protein
MFWDPLFDPEGRLWLGTGLRIEWATAQCRPNYSIATAHLRPEGYTERQLSYVFLRYEEAVARREAEEQLDERVRRLVEERLAQEKRKGPAGP